GLIGKPVEKTRYAAEADETAAVINRLMWHGDKGFYLDLQLDGKQAPIKTISGFWPLLAKVASPAQADALQKHLANPKTFGTRHRVPTCAADEPPYPAAVYCQG